MSLIEFQLALIEAALSFCGVHDFFDKVKTKAAIERSSKYQFATKETLPYFDANIDIYIENLKIAKRIEISCVINNIFNIETIIWADNGRLFYIESNVYGGDISNIENFDILNINII